jgi:hypothetical protein
LHTGKRPPLQDLRKPPPVNRQYCRTLICLPFTVLELRLVLMSAIKLISLKRGMQMVLLVQRS